LDECRGQLRSVTEMAASTDLEPKNGLHYEYYYDAAGRLETVETPSGQAEYAYYVNGSRKSLTLPNQVTTTYLYDDLLRLDKVEHRDSGLDLLAEFDYTVGRTGKRSGVAEEIDGYKF
jgi:YD repeat-containing protein